MKSNTTILPLSLENNSTLTGTGVILNQFGDEFSIPTNLPAESVPFDSNSNSFSLKKARDHTEFILMMNYHKEQRMQYDHHLSSVEKEGDVMIIVLRKMKKMMKVSQAMTVGQCK